MFWLGVVVGLGLGGTLGVAFMALFQVAKSTVESDYKKEKTD